MAHAGREPNTALAQVIRESGSSNKGLASRVRAVAGRHGVILKCDHVSVRRWIDGVQPQPETARFIAEALGEKLNRRIVPSELGFRAVIDDALMAHAPGVYHVSARGAVEALASLVLSDDACAPTVSADVEERLWYAAAMGWRYDPPDHEHASTSRSRKVSAADVAAVEGTASAFMAMDFQFGGGHGRAMLCRYFHENVLPLLRDVADDTNGRALLSAAASVTQLLGWTAYDLGWHQRAQQYMAQGLRLAREADDHMLGARLLANMSHQATYLGRFREARHLAIAASEGVSGRVTPAVSAMLLAMHARASAGAGDSREAAQVLSRAEAALDKANPCDEPAWIAYFDRSELAGEAAHCFRDLKQPRTAAPFISEALTLTPPSLTRTRAFILLVQAASCLHSRDVDGACDYTLQALKDGQGLKSERYRRYLRDVVADFESYRGVSVDIVTREVARALAA